MGVEKTDDCMMPDGAVKDMVANPIKPILPVDVKSDPDIIRNDKKYDYSPKIP